MAEDQIVLMRPSEAAAAGLGNQIGGGIRSVVEYNQLRNGYKVKLESVKEELAKCTDPKRRAELTEELEYWQGLDIRIRNVEGEMLRAMGGHGLNDFDDLKAGFVSLIQNYEAIMKKRELDKEESAERVMIAHYYELVEGDTSPRRFERAVKALPELVSLHKINRSLCWKQSLDPNYRKQVDDLYKSGQLANSDAYAFAMAFTDPLTNMKVRSQTIAKENHWKKVKKSLKESRVKIAADYEAAKKEFEPLDRQFGPLDGSVRGSQKVVQNLSYLKMRGDWDEKKEQTLLERKAEMDESLKKLEEIRPRHAALQRKISDLEQRKHYNELDLNPNREKEVAKKYRGDIKLYNGVDIQCIATCNSPPSLQELKRWQKEYEAEKAAAVTGK